MRRLKIKRKRGDSSAKMERCFRVTTSLGELYVHAEGETPRCVSFLPPEPDVVREGEEPPLAVHRLTRALISALEGREPDRGVVEKLLASPGLTEFQRRVYRAVLSIPRGSTLSYREVAEMAGYPRAARAVGNAMRRNPFPVIIPCHRVIRSDGSLGEYSGPTGMKERLLRQEGVRIETSRESRIARSRDGDKAVDPAAKQ